MEKNISVSVIEYIQNLKSEQITKIRMLEVEASRNFDEILFIIKSMNEDKKEPLDVQN